MNRVFYNCIVCGYYLSGQQEKYCSAECGWSVAAKGTNDRKLKKMKDEARMEYIKLNSSKRAVIQIKKLMKDGN